MAERCSKIDGIESNSVLQPEHIASLDRVPSRMPSFFLNLFNKYENKDM